MKFVEIVVYSVRDGRAFESYYILDLLLKKVEYRSNYAWVDTMQYEQATWGQVAMLLFRDYAGLLYNGRTLVNCIIRRISGNCDYLH